MLETVDNFIQRITEERVKKEEKRIFEEMVADRKLIKIMSAQEELAPEKTLDFANRVFFCNAKTRDFLLRSVRFFDRAACIVSNIIPELDLYELTDEKLKQRILCSGNVFVEKKIAIKKVLGRLREHTSKMYGVELSGAEQALCIEALERYLAELE